jgi:hypothetical protein
LTELLVEPMPHWGIFEYTRQRAEAIRGQNPPPPEPVYAIGSDLPMESLSLAYEDDLITPGGIAKAGRCLQFRKRDMQSARSRKRTRVPDCMAMPE